MNLLRLSSLLNKPDLHLKSEGIFKAFHSAMTDHPPAMAGLIGAFIYYLQKPKQVNWFYNKIVFKICLHLNSEKVFLILAFMTIFVILDYHCWFKIS